MKNDTFTTPEILDVTEVEKCKIREAAETDRKRIAESEITAREIDKNSKEKWTEGGFQGMFGLTTAAIAFALMTSFMFYTCKKYPDLPSAADCKESVAVVRGDQPFYCSAGASLESKPVGDRGDVQMRCVCRK